MITYDVRNTKLAFGNEEQVHDMFASTTAGLHKNSSLDANNQLIIKYRKC
jgi:hypothetical protein